jgi:hypothetical protein
VRASAWGRGSAQVGESPQGAARGHVGARATATHGEARGELRGEGRRGTGGGGVERAWERERKRIARVSI